MRLRIRSSFLRGWFGVGDAEQRECGRPAEVGGEPVDLPSADADDVAEVDVVALRHAHGEAAGARPPGPGPPGPGRRPLPSRPPRCRPASQRPRLRASGSGGQWVTRGLGRPRLPWPAPAGTATRRSARSRRPGCAGRGAPTPPDEVDALGGRPAVRAARRVEGFAPLPGGGVLDHPEGVAGGALQHQGMIQEGGTEHNPFVLAIRHGAALSETGRGRPPGSQGGKACARPKGR